MTGFIKNLNLLLLQGDLTQQEKRAVFLTVHDLGCNRKLKIINLTNKLLTKVIFLLILDASFQDFVNSPCMSEIKERSCFIHVDVPGHADNTSPLAEK